MSTPTFASNIFSTSIFSVSMLSTTILSTPIYASNSLSTPIFSVFTLSTTIQSSPIFAALVFPTSVLPTTCMRHHRCLHCPPRCQLLYDCWTLQAANDPQCDPNKHDRVCHWCCQDEQCMKDLALGIKPQPEGNTMAPAKTTMAHLPTGPVSMAPTTKAPTTKTPTTQVVKVDTTMAAGTPGIII